MLPPTSGTKAIAFTATARPSEARVFYRDTLGLPLIEDTPFALVFDAFGTMLRVQKSGVVEPHSYTSFGFEVPDIEAAVRGLAEAGVEMLRYPHFQQDALGVWTAPSGDRVCWFRDPDGNVISLSQF
jgi:catechol 2,3-dioxygenase-like lactoylglutathione lyase family enzyme